MTVYRYTKCRLNSYARQSIEDYLDWPGNQILPFEVLQLLMSRSKIQKVAQGSMCEWQGHTKSTSVLRNTLMVLQYDQLYDAQRKTS
jgi:hypothetical protein